MKLLVTGANGFLGRHVVAEAVAAGHVVTALVRSPTDHHEFDSTVQVVDGDLRSRGTWTESLSTIDAVVHAAAAPGGSRSHQLANTVVATERFLEALNDVAIKRFVHVSSLSVYDFQTPPRGAPLDERLALEQRPQERDAYTEAKLVQERLVRVWCAERCVPCVIVRPGVIVGPGKAWGYGAAFGFGRLAFVVSPKARFRVISVANCAEAIVRAVDAHTKGVNIVNLVDDDPPTHAEFFRTCVQAGASDRIMVPVPWVLLESLGRLLRFVSIRMLRGRLRTPELLDLRRQEARWKPFNYPNDKASRVLGWHSTQSLDETVRLAVGPAVTRSSSEP